MRAAVAALLLALVAAACGTGGAEGGATGDGTVEITLFGGPAEIAAYTELATSFEAANPDLEVVLNPVASQDDLLATLTTSFAGGRPPDAFLVNYLKYGQFAAQGALAEVQDLIDADAADPAIPDAIDLADFAPPSVEAFRFDGERLTCMPQNVSSLVAYVNVDAFQAAGLDLPAAGWTWEDLLAAARALTDPAEGRYGIGFDMSLQRLAPFAWSAGGELVDDPQRPTALTLDDPATRRALDFLLDLQLVHGVVPPDVEEQSLEAEERFIDGRLGVYLASRVAVPTLREGITTFTFDAAPLPVAPGGTPATVLHGDAYCLPADGDVDAAWRFVRHAMSVEGQTVLAATGRTVPSRLEVAASPVFTDPDLPPASSEVFTDVIPSVRALPRTATWSEMQREVDSTLTDVLYGRIDREAGIADAMAAAASIMAREPAVGEGGP